MIAAVLVLLLGAGEASGSRLLRAPPMVGRTTREGTVLQVVVGPSAVRIEVELGLESESTLHPLALAPAVEVAEPVHHWRTEAVGTASEATDPAAARSIELPAGVSGEIELTGLGAGSTCRWRIVVSEAAAGERSGAAVAREQHVGRFATARPRGSPFTFAVFSDTHVFPEIIEPELPPEARENESYLAYMLESVGWYRTTRERVGREAALVFDKMNGDRPDFVVSLGDVFDLHGRGFNWAFTSDHLAAAAHLEARRALGALRESGTIYQVLGNWEAESGCHPAEQRAFARRARLLHAVNPRPDTSPLGGSPDEDYFAFEWGDLLGIVLNVRGYTPTPHHLGSDGVAEGRPDDFTLGPQQRDFLARTLAASDHAYQVLFIHHAVGGNGGNPFDSAYGRGGGRAAKVGEQAWVHEQCVRNGTQLFFYGHDHVFTHLEVEGVHYALPGTTSAPWRFEPAETGYEKYWPDSGYARVTVAPAALRVEFVPLRGEVLHAFDVAPRAPR